jgi:hypothetical protein
LRRRLDTGRRVRAGVGVGGDHDAGAKAGLNLKPGLIELLLRDLASSSSAGTTGATYEPGALPLLSHALLATWHHRARRTLTVAGYQSAGGIHGAQGAVTALFAVVPTRTYGAAHPRLRAG